VNSNIDSIIAILKKEHPKKRPIVSEIAGTTKNPFLVLISCLLSLRTKDDVTEQASRRLFEIATTPESILAIPLDKLSSLIYPVGFYKTKAKTLHHVSHEIINRFSGKVPDTIDDLLTLNGVGRKTANLVITLGYNKLGICVDTHVHRISNRLGIVKTTSPTETEFALRKILPKKYWIIYNDLLVSYGQRVCKPISPFCSLCKLSAHCPRIGVTKSR